MDRPLVSVVMGVYNGADQLPETIDSVLAQSFEKFELVIVDDGSDDPGVRSILEEYAARHQHVRVIHRPHEGLTRALRAGCQVARGEYIARIDAGDRMVPERLGWQVDVLARHEKCVLCTGATQICGPRWEPLWIARPVQVSGEATPVFGYLDCSEEGIGGYHIDIAHHGSVLFRRAAYERAGGYREQFYYGQDWDLWYRLSELGTVAVLPQVIYHARLFPAGISMRSARAQEHIARCSLEACRARRSGGDEEPWLEKAASIRPTPGQRADRAKLEPGFYFIGEALRRNGDRRCRAYLLRALVEKPWSLRVWVRLAQSLGLLLNHNKKFQAGGVL